MYKKKKTFGELKLLFLCIALCVLAMSCEKMTLINEEIYYTLSITAQNGYVIKNPDKSLYASGEVVTLTAFPYFGCTFLNWSGDISSTDSMITVTMDRSKRVVANFTGITYTLTITATNGNVTKNPDKPSYTAGEMVTLTAVPDSGYSFFGWSGDASGTSATTTVTMYGNMSVSADFIAGTIGTVTDIDGNVYHTVKIGNQEWMIENLRTTRYNDSTPITLDTSTVSWANATTEKFCYYENADEDSLMRKFGALYNWHAVNTKKLAPPGWRVPDTTDWNVLENYLIANGYNWDGAVTGNKIAKSMASKAYWQMSSSPGAIGNDPNKNNRSGFSALPCGYRFYEGNFLALYSYAGWWSATEDAGSYAHACELFYGVDGLRRSNTNKSCGLAVRLLRE